jgi:hypothetical protein
MPSPFQKAAVGRIATLVLLGVLGVWLLHDLVDAVRYFAHDYRRLQQIGLAVMVGAPLLLIFRMLSVAWRRSIGSCVLALVASAITVFGVYVLRSCWRLREMFTESGGAWLMALVCLMVWGYAAWFWWLAWGVWDRKTTADPGQTS